jgi:7,8-dihydropterin-6-yl-methyl-4-(beta-D-ribofuranosyl)aminobenzene 5'-phosphate synthase
VGNLSPVERAEVQILVDNASDGLSKNPANVEGEFAFALRRGVRAYSGRCLCCAVHGFSCIITAHRAGSSHSLLFDSGPEDYAFERNTLRLGADLGKIESVVLSHGHWDHSGAMLTALAAISARRGAHDIPFYAHPDMFRKRAMKGRDGTLQMMDDIPSIEELASYGAQVICTKEPQILHDRMFYISGEIPRVTAFEHGLRGQMRRTEDGRSWESDELILDERWLAVHVEGKGLVIFSACSHAGIVNVLKHATEVYPDIPIHAVIGGLHLSGANEEIIPQTVEAMKNFRLKKIAAAHCTGWRAVSALNVAFGDDIVVPCAVGKRYSL